MPYSLGKSQKRQRPPVDGARLLELARPKMHGCASSLPMHSRLSPFGAIMSTGKPPMIECL
eukprot:6730550-Karenia_brevis.AAC.1